MGLQAHAHFSPSMARQCVRDGAGLGEWIARDVSGREAIESWRDLRAPQRSTMDAALDAEIAVSTALLAGGDDLDEAAPAVDPNARARAITFLRAHVDKARAQGFTLAIPRILPGPGGSVDLHWELDDFEILMNFPVDPAAPASFYGDDRRDGGAIKGKIAAPDSRSMLPWLIR